MNKPNGQFRVANNADEVEQFVQKLPVRKMHGIGKVSAFILKEAFEIETVRDLYEKRHFLPFGFKKASLEYYLHSMIGNSSNVGNRFNQVYWRKQINKQKLNQKSQW